MNYHRGLARLTPRREAEVFENCFSRRDYQVSNFGESIGCQEFLADLFIGKPFLVSLGLLQASCFLLFSRSSQTSYNVLTSHPLLEGDWLGVLSALLNSLRYLCLSALIFLRLRSCSDYLWSSVFWMRVDMHFLHFNLEVERQPGHLV